MTLQEELDVFMEAWHGVSVTAYDDCLVYKVVHGFAKSAAFRATQLISTLNLNLIAEATTDNSFIIKINDNEKSKGKDQY
jgi:hypothetical protein